MNEYLHTSNKEGDTGRKMIIETEVVHKNLNTLNNKGNKMNNEMNNEITDIAQDINMDDAEKELQEILDKQRNYPEISICYDFIEFGDTLSAEIESFKDLVYIPHFKHLKKFIVQVAIPRVKSLEEKVFKLAIEHIAIDEDISQCIMSVTRAIRRTKTRKEQMEQYLFLLEKLLDIKPDTHHIDHMLDDLYQYNLTVTHSDAERISSLLNYPIPACRGKHSLLPVA